MARCPHQNINEMKCCLDCGRSVLESDEEYFAYLKRLKFGRKGELSYQIEKLEIELGIRHPGNKDDGICFSP